MEGGAIAESKSKASGKPALTLCRWAGAGKEEEVAKAVVILVSNGYITGQTNSLNGGWHMI